jgi:hypothetical protein
VLVFDTVRLAVDVPDLNIDPLLSRGWVRQITQREDASGEQFEGQVYRRFPPKDSEQAEPYLEYVPGESLRLEVSLPRFLYSDNVQLLRPADVSPVLDKLSAAVGDLAGDVPSCDKWHIAGRADAVYSWDCRDDKGESRVSDYLHAFRPVELSRHYSQAVDRESTLYWRNKQRVIRMYDKQEESGADHAAGLLRFEVQTRRFKRELVSAGTMKQEDTPIAGDYLNWDTAAGLLGRYLDGLGAGLSISDEVGILNDLLEVYQPAKAFKLFGVIHALRLCGRDELEKSRGANRKSMWRYMSEIRAAGLSVGAAALVALAPLRLPDRYDGSSVCLLAA